jgi:hypothetical protein
MAGLWLGSIDERHPRFLGTPCRGSLEGIEVMMADSADRAFARSQRCIFTSLASPRTLAHPAQVLDLVLTITVFSHSPVASGEPLGESTHLSRYS